MAEWLLGKRRTPWVVAWCELALAGCAVLAATVLLVTAMAATEAAAGGGRDARPRWSQWVVVKEWVLTRIADNDREKERLRTAGGKGEAIFSARDWVRFRSSARFLDNICRFSSSSVLYGLRLQLGAVVLVAVVVLAMNTALARLASGAFQAGWRLALPMVPFNLSLSALCLLLVFRTNAAYARWTEGRALVGGIKSSFRDLARQVVTWLPTKDREVMIRRLCALIRLVSRFLRRSDGTWDPEAKVVDDKALLADLTQLLGRAEADRLMGAAHPALAGLADLSAIVQEAPIGIMASDRFEQALSAINNAIGTCERILRNPTPLVYTRHTSRFLAAWCLLLPLGLYTELKGSLLLLPISIVLSAFLLGIEELGVQIEEPFSIIAIESIFESVKVDVINIYQGSVRPADIGLDASSL